LRYGYTTGACAAAATKAALLKIYGKESKKVTIVNSKGERIEIPILRCEKIDDHSAYASVVKDAGDDAPDDVTHGLEIISRVLISAGGGILLKGGEGVGVVTKRGLPVAVGEPAINPMPRLMMEKEVRELVQPGFKAEITIEVPRGRKVAGKTSNPKLGIIGGISIIGTTGIVVPRSTIAFKQVILQQIAFAVAQGHRRLVLVPGNIGEEAAVTILNPPKETIIQMGDHVGFTMDSAVQKGINELILVGHPGKMVKLAASIFNTHYSMGDGRQEVIAAFAALRGAPQRLIEQILGSTTVDEIIPLLTLNNLTRPTFDEIAKRISQKSLERLGSHTHVSAIIVSRDGVILGTDCKEVMEGKG